MRPRVILAGGGHAHLAVLADWAVKPMPDTERWLVTSSRFTAYSGMVPGWLAGIYRADDLLIDLAPLAERAGAQLILADVVGLDPARQMLNLSSGDDMAFDLLSVATGGETDTSDLADAAGRLLPVRPMSLFMERWSHLLRAHAHSPTINVAVVGGGAAGVELVLGADIALRTAFPSLQLSLVTPGNGFLSGHAEHVRELVQKELADRGIAVHFAQAVGAESGLLLSNGHFLPADCIIAATGSRAPPWLAQSGLACNDQGFVAVGADLRSVSHPCIFAAGDIIDRTDRRLERSGVHAVKAGPVLAANLRATLDGSALRPYAPRNSTLYLLALGDKRAIVSWGHLVGSGRWVWRLKDWIDGRFVARHRNSNNMSGRTR